MKKTLGLIMLLFSCIATASSPPETQLLEPVYDPYNKSSLRSGAKEFMSNCVQCHSTQYLRYSRLSEDLNWPEDKIEQAGGRLKDIFILTKSDDDSSNNQAELDLSLLGRVKGAKYTYNYIHQHLFEGSTTTQTHIATYSGKNPTQKAQIVTDLTNFLMYAAEPIAAKRKQYGYYVIAFLIAFLGLSILLKQAYWKQLKK